MPESSLLSMFLDIFPPLDEILFEMLSSIQLYHNYLYLQDKFIKSA